MPSRAVDGPWREHGDTDLQTESNEKSEDQHRYRWSKIAWCGEKKKETRIYRHRSLFGQRQSGSIEWVGMKEGKDKRGPERKQRKYEGI